MATPDTPAPPAPSDDDYDLIVWAETRRFDVVELTPDELRRLAEDHYRRLHLAAPPREQGGGLAWLEVDYAARRLLRPTFDEQLAELARVAGGRRQGRALSTIRKVAYETIGRAYPHLSGYLGDRLTARAGAAPGGDP